MTKRTKIEAAPWADSALCLDVVNAGTRSRKFGCPCALKPDHEPPHACACGTQWNRIGGRAVADGEPVYPAICGWAA